LAFLHAQEAVALESPIDRLKAILDYIGSKVSGGRAIRSGLWQRI